MFELDAAPHMEILDSVIQAEDGHFTLPDAPIPGLDDRPARALNVLIGALQRLGSARISALTDEVNQRMPCANRVDEQYVRTWLTSHSELFAQAESDRFELGALDVDTLRGLATSFMPHDRTPAVAASRPAHPAVERFRERVAADIAALLRREGPQPIHRIRSHLYGRFIGLGSADVVVAQRPHRFARHPTGLVSLQDSRQR